MKKVILALMTTGFFLACNQGSDKAGDTHSTGPGEIHQGHEKNPAGLDLNNGVKWKADSSTRSNVALLQGISANANQESLAGYHATAVQLEEGLNKMVKECKMKGADHEALHKWLEPLMENTKELKKQTVVENAAVSLKKIEQQLNIFPQYFE